jgi:hypothetical protein
MGDHEPMESPARHRSPTSRPSGRGVIALRGLLLVLGLSALSVAAHTVLMADVFLSPVRMALQVVLPTIVGAAALAALLLRSESQLVALLCALAVTGGVLAAELHLERAAIAQPQVTWTPWAPTEAIAYPEICGKYVMVVDPDGRVRSALEADGREVQPVAGISGNPLGDGRVSDAYGFGNPPGEWQRAGGRWMAVGDSFAAGADVEYGHGFVEQLRDKIGPIVNLGCSWNGPLLELASLVEYGPLTRPSTVLWFFYEGNDLTDLELELRAPLLRRYLEAGFRQELARRVDLIDDLLRVYSRARLDGTVDGRLLEHVIFGDPDGGGVDWRRVLYFQNLRWSQGLIDFATSAAVFRELRAVLERAASFVADGWGGRVVFVYLPSEHRFVGEIVRREADSHRRRVLEEAAAVGLDVIDLTPEFARHERPRSLFAGHYTVEGNAIVARAVADWFASARPVAGPVGNAPAARP